MVLVRCSSGIAEDIDDNTNIKEIRDEKNNESRVTDNSHYIGPIKSGSLDKLPWDNDKDFLDAKKEHNTPILMSAYCAVLKDPLPGEEVNVHHGARLISGKVVEPGVIFSQNKEIGPYSEENGFKEGPTYVGAKVSTTIGGGVCKISSTLYNIAVLANLEIVERHNHNMPVPYVPYGQDATVAYGAKDFRFKNNTDFPLLIWAKGIDNRLYMAIYGQESPPDVKWQHQFLNRQKAPVIYKTNPNLSANVENILLEGMDGVTVNSWVIITDKEGSAVRKFLGTSYYNPMPYLIERSN